jgi:hypothetical protein
MPLNLDVKVPMVVPGFSLELYLTGTVRYSALYKILLTS